MHSGALLDVELTKATPDLLNEALVAGDLDVGPISLVEYLRHADDLLVLPDIAVGSDGDVLSVNLVSAVPLGEIRSVALGATSRTSVLLARMLLEDRDGLRPTYTTMPPDLPMMLREADAAVLIGDAALRATYEAEQAGPSHPLTVVDLGAQWRAWSGRPMVFAVWAARRDFAERNPGAVKEVHRAFRSSLDMALADVEEVATRAARWEVFDPATLARYFRTLDFSLGERQVAGITAFAARAAERRAVAGLPRHQVRGRLTAGQRPVRPAPATAVPGHLPPATTGPGRAGSNRGSAAGGAGQRLDDDAQLPQQPRVGRAGRADQEVLRLLVLREGDDLPDRPGVGQSTSIRSSRGDAPVRRGAVAERVHHVPELLVHPRPG